MANKQTNHPAGKKIRKLYHLDPEDARFVREQARQKGVSESELVRLAVRAYQKKLDGDPFLELLGSVEAGENQASRHDEVIYD